MILEERIRYDKDKQALLQKISNLEKSLATASLTTCPPASSNALDQRVKQQDSYGNNWFQVAHYCSKHGYNISHSNEYCRDRNKPGRDTWIQGATHADHKGGSDKNKEHYLQWFNPNSKRHAPAPP